ncbi:MAG: MBL fold metallo-hydrolase [Chitinophagaceae bacterium]|nr:MAG: MBL fold metallo-hydrolase [Chitinophagaceae bacterium]
MQLYTIDTGFFKLDGGAMFGVVPKSIWSRLQPADDKNLCTWAMRCLLIEDNNRLILIDTGIGNKQDDKFFSHYYLHGDATLEKSLALHGFHPDDITDVLLTHLHFDHVGGSVVRKDNKLVPAFSNAIYWSNQKHWSHAVKPNAREKASFLSENILPIEQSAQLKFIEYPAQAPGMSLQPGAETDAGLMNLPSVSFTENISIRSVSGHTESMMLPEIRYKNRTIVYVADLLPCISHLPIPYVMAYDIEPLKTLEEKQVFLKEGVEKDYILFFEHDPKLECCTIRETEKGIREKEVFRLSDI